MALKDTLYKSVVGFFVWFTTSPKETPKKYEHKEKCPKCGSFKVNGGCNTGSRPWVIALFILTLLPLGIILWCVWRKKVCYNCGLNFS